MCVYLWVPGPSEQPVVVMSYRSHPRSITYGTGLRVCALAGYRPKRVGRCKSMSVSTSARCAPFKSGADEDDTRCGITRTHKDTRGEPSTADDTCDGCETQRWCLCVYMCVSVFLVDTKRQWCVNLKGILKSYCVKWYLNQNLLEKYWHTI